MARLVFSKGELQKFFRQVKERTGLDWRALGKVAGVSGRTLRDWQREKFLPSRRALLQLSEFSGVSLPEISETRRDYWNNQKAARKGGIIRYATCGNPGTPEGRKKGAPKV